MCPVWLSAQSSRHARTTKSSIAARELRQPGATLANQPSLRFASISFLRI
jgi:hypothetical protein